MKRLQPEARSLAVVISPQFVGFSRPMCQGPGRKPSARLDLDSERRRSLLRYRLVRIVRNISREHGIAQSLVVAHGVQETLAGHIPIVETRHAVGSHDALYRAVIVKDLVFD